METLYNIPSSALRLLLQIGRTGNLTEAARACGIS
ncbi:LysR family transcriptional regulator [Sinorhizobium numidicum]|nr:LysR family transcriptional regulator [Sinorhizobium numidicum]